MSTAGTAGRRRDAHPLQSDLPSQSSPVHVEDDPSFPSAYPGDESWAEDLQLQEVILYSAELERRRRRGRRSNDLGASASDIGDEAVVITPILLDESVDDGASVVEVSTPPDRKGKRKVDFQSNREDGPSSSKSQEQLRSHIARRQANLLQCSNAIIVDGHFDCGICMERVEMWKSFQMNSCVHNFCTVCIGRYVEAKVGENVVSIKCPDPRCQKGFLEPDMCRNIISSKLFRQWGFALCESALGPMKFYCPYKDCSALLIDDGGDGQKKITNAICPHCHRMFCAHCKVRWHDGITCEDYEKLGVDERGNDDLMVRKMASDSHWQRCPNCKMYVERIDGCQLMRCRCGYCFCYTCASPMSLRLHFCQKCQR